MVEKRFTNKVVVVTGTTKGIGLACAERLKKEGAIVCAIQRGHSSFFDSFEFDLSKEQDCSKSIDAIIKKHGRIDVLINNAGIMKESSLLETSLEDWNQALSVNLTAPFLLSKFAMPFLIESKGSIINIGSIEGIGANPNHAAYCSSKAGLHGLTRAIAVDHGKDGVRCNAVAPGWIDTELNEDFINSMPDSDHFRKNIGSIHPLNRTGKTEEVASLVSWLASSESSFVTGQVYTIDGGRMAKISLPNP
jgi:meso-butanediol dehydrogenase / (S,S)-butanediol dehydrogenase / diacetyl reductase